MNNPWLEIPLADYEEHMALPGIEQAQLLADIFSGAIQQYSPMGKGTGKRDRGRVYLRNKNRRFTSADF